MHKPQTDADTFTDAQQRILRSLAHGLGLGTSAALEGIHRETLRLWRKQQPAFGIACARAKAQQEAAPTDVVWQAIQAGDIDVARWWLERRSPAFRKDAPLVDADEAEQTQRRVRFVRASGVDVPGPAGGNG